MGCCTSKNTSDGGPGSSIDRSFRNNNPLSPAGRNSVSLRLIAIDRARRMRRWMDGEGDSDRDFTFAAAISLPDVDSSYDEEVRLTQTLIDQNLFEIFQEEARQNQTTPRSPSRASRSISLASHSHSSAGFIMGSTSLMMMSH